MQKSKIDIFKQNSKFYKLDFGIDRIDNLDQNYLLVFLSINRFSGMILQLKKKP